MRFLLDMNLSPAWLELLRSAGLSADHWSTIGEVTAQDSEIMEWARLHGCIVLTHDLDFGILLAHSGTEGPSVVQIRARNIHPDHLGTALVSALRTHRYALIEGALLTLDEAKSRIRVLPF